MLRNFQKKNLYLIGLGLMAEGLDLKDPQTVRDKILSSDETEAELFVLKLSLDIRTESRRLRTSHQAKGSLPYTIISLSGSSQNRNLNPVEHPRVEPH